MLCVFIDAWNPAYLKHMPFLNSLKKSCLHGELEVPLGYTDIIASFMTGMHPDKHGIFDLFVPDMPRCRIKNPYILAAIRLLQNKRMFYTPLKVQEAEYFKPSMDKTWAQKDCLSCKTIFDILEKSRKSFEVIDWPNHFRNRNAGIFFSKSCKTASNMAKKSKADLTFVHFLDLEIAHKHGTNAEETINAAKQIDNAARELYEKDGNILFFSDHGMNDIKKEVDIGIEIKKLNLKFGKDLLYIVGSTTAEFWFKNEKAKKIVAGMLKKLKYGKIINKGQFNIKTDSTVFLADFQTAFYQNFFSQQHFKAMHGWSPKQQKTLYILKNQARKGRKDARIVDFMPTILRLMKLPQAKCDGRSLI